MSIKTDLEKAVRYGNSVIASKGGDENGATIRDVMDNIGTITTGEDLGTGSIKVDFIYIDDKTGEYKTVTKRCNKGESVTAPNVGDIPAIRGVCPALTFQGWNYDLSILTNIQRDVNVGAMYITSDGWSWLKIRVTKTTGVNPTDALNQIVWLTKLNASTLTLRVEDLDGGLIVDTTRTNEGLFSIQLLFTSIGDYWIKTKITSGVGTYTFGGGTTSNVIFGGGVQYKREMLLSCFIGDSVVTINNSAFYSCKSMILITIPNGITNIGGYALQYCSSLTSIVIPQKVVSIGNYAFQYCYSTTTITIPQGITSIENGVFYNCYSLYSITIPQGVVGIVANAFYNLQSMTSIVFPQSVISIGDNAFAANLSVKVYDFSNATSIPILVSTTALQNIISLARIVVPDYLYENWIIETNWATYANYIISKTDYENLNL